MPKSLRILCLVFLLLAIAPSDRARASEPELRVGDIRIFGNKKIKSYILLRELPFRKGDTVNEEKLQTARDRIGKIPGVDFSDVRLSYIPYDSLLIANVIITEKRTLQGSLLLSRGFENRVSIGVRAEDTNFRGRSEKLSATALFRGNTVLEAGWQNPWIGGPLHLGVGMRSFFEKYKYVYNDLGNDLYGAEIKRAGASVTLFHPVGEGNRVLLEGGFETVKSKEAGMTLEKDKDTYFSIALGMERDSRKSKAFPWDATFVSARVEFIGPGSDSYSIIEGTVDARRYTSLFSRTVIAFQGLYRSKTGDNIPAYRREHMGGSRTLRAYDYGSFNGVNILLGTLEYRVPINFSKEESVEDVLLGLCLQLFSETGVVWEKGQVISSDTAHSSFGLGISLLTKNATGIRFDYAWHTRSSGRWEFDAGLKF